ncbi:MAG: hypothetical protein ACUVTN_10635 [Thermodesulfobacteriota bacterium]
MLKKKEIPYLTIFILILLFICLSLGIPFAQGKRSEEPEPHHIQMLKQLKSKIEGWLKSINERIESEDITRFEVRFLEILRSLLEWSRDKIDQWIGSEGKKSERRLKGEDL